MHKQTRGIIRWSLFLLLGSVVVFPRPAHADTIWWQFSSDCEAGAPQTELWVDCESTLDCVGRTERLYGCLDDCTSPVLLAENVTWQDVTCTCHCMIGEGSFPCGAQPVCEQPNDYWKCSYQARTTLDLPCEQLGFDTLCTVPTCPERPPSLDGYCTKDNCQGACAELYTHGAERRRLCPGGSWGCDTGATGDAESLRGANLAVLITLLLFLLGALYLVRRMRARARPPQR